MADIPRYGRQQVRAPGPSGIWPGGGTVYDQGKAAWGKAFKQIGAELGDIDERIKTAHETTELLTRTSRFSLGLQDIREKVKTSVPFEQWDEQYAADAESLRNRMKEGLKLRPEAEARLDTYFADQMTREIGRLKEEKLRAQISLIEKGLAEAEQTAIETQDYGLYRLTMDKAEERGMISEGMRTDRLAQFPVSSALAGIRKQMDTIDKQDVPVDEKVWAYDRLATELEEMRTGEMTEDQRKAATRLLETVRQETKAQRIAADKAQEDRIEATGRMVYGDIDRWFKSGGKEGRDYTMNEIDDLYITGALTKEMRDTIVATKTQVHPPQSDWQALGRVREAILRLKASGANDTAKQEALSAFHANVRFLSRTDAGSMFNRIYEDYESLQAKTQLDAEHLIDEIIREKDRFSGFFTNDRNQILGAAKAKMWLDSAIQEAIAKGTPIQDTDLTLLAMNIAVSARAEIDSFKESHGKESLMPVPQKEEFRVVRPKTLTLDIAMEYLRRANNDKELAKELAKQDGYVE